MPRSGSTTARGYGAKHQAERERHRPAVEAGQAECAELACLATTRWIAPGTPWDLAHDRANGGYLGPAHRKCNRAEGARYRNRGGRRNAPAPQRDANRWTL